MEIWKTIEGFKDYQISNFGRVKSLPRISKNRYGNYLTKEKILTSNIGFGGYKFQKIDCKNFSIHRLVCKYFIDKIEGKNIVNHKDLNILNNNASNLEWVTSRENTHHYEKNQNRTSKYIGVCFDKSRNKWSAKIKINGKTINLGRFNSDIEASAVYQTKLKEIV